MNQVDTSNQQDAGKVAPTLAGDAQSVAPSSASTHPVIRVFEPAMCCSTGVCGADVDESLVRFTADLRYLQDRGVDIQRHNLAQDAQTFVDNAVVRNFLQVVGSPGLPLVLVNDVTVATGRYPSRDEFLRYAGLGADAEAAGAVIDLGVTDVSASCCGSASADSTSCCGGASADSTSCCGGASSTCCSASEASTEISHA